MLVTCQKRTRNEIFRYKYQQELILEILHLCIKQYKIKKNRRFL